MNTFPLVSHSSLDQPLAWRGGEAITVRRFLADVARLAELLLPTRHVLNVCRDRYRFTVGLAAAIATGKVSLLPPTHTPEMVQQLKAFSADVFCLHDGEHCDIALPQVRFSDLTESHSQVIEIPQVDCGQCVAVVFTSGSTSTPVPHPKTWGLLVRNVRAQALRLGLESDAGCVVVGTVPPQHMYGFESTVLLPLQSGNALSSTQPFYPADICGALDAVPAPRMLVSTPLHLRLLLEAGLDLPQVKLVLSATAPLSVALAQKVEVGFGAPLLEIYGSTETGQIATRRTTQTPEWRLFPGVRFIRRGEEIWAEGGHVERAIALNDRIEPISQDRFLLHGRLQDLVNIAGKRSSLASLNHHLTSIEGVIDGAFYMPDETSHDHVTRLSACVVAPGLSAQAVMTALRERIDPVFLPRPLLFVDALPRNSTGKLPREALKQLIERRSSRKAA